MLKKRKKRKAKKISVDNLDAKIIGAFRNDSALRMSLKQVLRKIKVSNSIDSIQSCLDRLVEKRVLFLLDSGKYKLDRKPARQQERQERGRKSDKVATGIVDMTRNGSAFIISEDSGLEKDIFVIPKKLHGALNGDKVELRWFMARRNRPEGEVTRILERNRDHFIGTLVLGRQYALVISDDQALPVDIMLNRETISEDYQDGDKVIVKIVEWHSGSLNDSPKGQLVNKLGKSGSNDAEMQSILIEKGFNLFFPEEVLEENASIEEEIDKEEIAKRRDMREVLTFTIDPATAKDFDDALSIQTLENGNYEIGIHIADVSHYVKEGSALDKEAAQRTTSVYLVDRVLPMLPEKLSNGVCSLRPHEEKLCFSAVFEFSPEGDVVGEWFGRTAIYSDRRFTYEEAQEVLETGEGDYPEELRLLNRFAHKLRKARYKKGSINFESPEVRFKLDEQASPVGVYLKVRKDAHMLVEDYMLLANKRVGARVYNVFKEEGGAEIPNVYRVHDTPDMEKVGKFTEFAGALGYPMKIVKEEQVARSFSQMLKKAEGKSEYAVLQQLAIRTMSKAEYSPNNIGHYGLAFKTYTHFTSPIRRYADVLAHRILQDVLLNNGKRMNKAKLEELCKHISKKERYAMEAERESRKYKQAEFMEKRIGQVFEAVITGMTERGIYAMCLENHCEGMVSFNNMYDTFRLDDTGFFIRSFDEEYKMGDRLWIKVLKTNIQKRQVDFAMLDPQDFEGQEEAAKPQPKTTLSAGDLLSKARYAFNQSKIKVFGDKRKEVWAYQLFEGLPQEEGIIELSYNPKALPKHSYYAQEVLPEEVYTGTPRHQKFWAQYFGEDQRMGLYFCPFHSKTERQLSDLDMQLGQELFKLSISALKPKAILSFSSTLRDYMVEQGLVEVEAQREVSKGKFSFKAIKARLKGGGTAIYFMPSPTLPMPKDVKEEAWKLMQ